jgi:hypothetical protein
MFKWSSALVQHMFNYVEGEVGRGTPVYRCQVCVRLIQGGACIKVS